MEMTLVLLCLTLLGLAAPASNPFAADAGERGPGLSRLARFICWMGVIASIGLTVLDWITSVMGIKLILGVPPGDPHNAIVMSVPILMATMALCFNALSGYFFQVFLREGFNGFSISVTLVLWIFFVSYDFASSLVGLLNTYSTVEVSDWNTAVQALGQLGNLAAFFVIVISALLSFGPFLATLFYHLLHVHK